MNADLSELGTEDVAVTYKYYNQRQTYIYNSPLPLSSGIIRPATVRGSAVGGVLGSDGVAFTAPYNQNDGGWLRVLGSSEDNTVLEIATGDDGGAGESIHFRGYNTSNAISYDVAVPKTSGTIALQEQTFKVTRGASVNTNTTGYWAAMCNTEQGSGILLPTNNQ